MPNNWLIRSLPAALFIKNHGVPQHRVDQMFKLSKRFFNLPYDQKMQCEWESSESNRGYSRQGKEKLSELDKQNRADDIKELKKISPDLKESYEVGKEGVEGYPNKFPKGRNQKISIKFFLKINRNSWTTANSFSSNYTKFP